MDEQTKRDKEAVARLLRRLDYLWQLVTVGVYGGFLALRIARGGNLVVLNSLLAAINIIYALAETIRYFAGADRAWRNRIRWVYRYIRLAFSALAIGITVYSILTAVNEPTTAELVLAVLAMVAFGIKLFFMAIGALVRIKVRAMRQKRRKARELRVRTETKTSPIKLIGKYLFGIGMGRPFPLDEPMYEVTEDEGVSSQAGNDGTMSNTKRLQTTMSEVKSKDATVTKTKTLDGIMSEEYEQPDEQFHFEGTMFEKWILNSTAKETHEGDGEEKAEEEKKKEKAMNLPEEVNLLASVLNLYLRDRYSSLDALCEDGELDRSLLEEKLNKGGYQYDEEHNCFRAK